MSAATRQLTEAHRLAQNQLGARLIARLAVLWRLLDPGDPHGTFADWLLAVTPVVAEFRRQSSDLAAAYLDTLRTIAVGEPGTIVLAEPLETGPLATSLMVTGPAAIERAVKAERPFAMAIEHAQARTSGVGMRHALNGGRETVIRTVGSDSKAKGWARGTSGAACAFCAMLASRGPVYTRGSVDFHSHDSCQCVAVPLFDSEWPAGARRYREQWDETTQGLSGDDALNAFRRALSR